MGRKKAKLPTRIIIPQLKPVGVRPAEWWEPVHRWYAYRALHMSRARGMRVYGAVRPWRAVKEVPRWDWPPIPQHGVHGWRARLIAQRWKRVWKRQMRWIPYDVILRLAQIEKGHLPFTYFWWQWLNREWEESRIATAPKQMRVTFGGPLSLGWKR